jgi:hypothetical protein
MKGFRSRPLTFSVRPTHCAATAIYLRSIYGSGLTTGTAQVMLPRDKNARDETWHCICSHRQVLSRHWDFLSAAGAFDRGQRMLELWNNWYETLASVEALATVIVFVVVAAGVITLVQGRRR